MTDRVLKTSAAITVYDTALERAVEFDSSLSLSHGEMLAEEYSSDGQQTFYVRIVRQSDNEDEAIPVSISSGGGSGSGAERATVTWLNEDGSLLATDSVAYGATPSFDGPTPFKDPTDQYVYTFVGWSPEIGSVTGDVSYAAVFVRTVRSYTVTFRNYDSSLLQSGSYEYGSIPSYSGSTPVRTSSNVVTDSFSADSYTTIYLAAGRSASATHVITPNIDDYRDTAR